MKSRYLVCIEEDHNRHWFTTDEIEESIAKEYCAKLILYGGDGEADPLDYTKESVVEYNASVKQACIFRLSDMQSLLSIIDTLKRRHIKMHEKQEMAQKEQNEKAELVRLINKYGISEETMK
jgi:hypothetical protein